MAGNPSHQPNVTRNAKKMDKDGRKCEATKVHPLICFRAPLKDMPIKKKT
jgi:hypothetical protein